MTAQPWEPRVARLEGIYEQVDKRLESIDIRLEGLRDDLGRRIDGLDRKIEAVDRKIERVEQKIDVEIGTLRNEISRDNRSIRGEISRLAWQTTSFIVGTWVTVMLAIFLHKP